MEPAFLRFLQEIFPGSENFHEPIVDVSDMSDSFYTINIGRQYGSGGLCVANRLSEKLQIKAYDKELINLAAKEKGVDSKLFIEADEKHRTSFLQGLIHSLIPLGDSTSSSYNGNIITSDSLFEAQSTVIRRIASEESCIFVGRCADYILRDREKVLNVFLTADDESRVERISSRVGITPDQALELIRQTDRDRAAYYNYYTFKKWGDSSSYDLSINTSRLGIEGTTDYIISFAREFLDL